MLNLVMPRSRLGVLVFMAVVTTMLTGCQSPAERTLNDIQFEARSGHDSTGELTWIADHPVRWRMELRNGEDTVMIGPPCGAIQAQADVTSTEIRVDMNRAAIAAIACEEPVASMDRWVHTFIGEPITYTWDEDVLTMTNNNGSLTFRRAETT